MEKTISGARRLAGAVAVPGDKSISHRAALLNAVASGPAHVSNFLLGEDCLSTLRSLRQLGVEWQLEPRGPQCGDLHLRGAGFAGLREPSTVLDAGNSGTTMRFLCGLLAGRPFLSVLAGDASLQRRPMGRVIEPLTAMGARIWGRANDTLPPLVIKGGRLRGIDYRLPVASAQLKSALLLAGLQAEGATRLSEPSLSRDHTERMLQRMGAPIVRDGVTLTVQEAKHLAPLDLEVPGDPSAAAFWAVAAVCHPHAELSIPDVDINPTRAGFLDVLRQMGAQIELRNERESAGEPVADLVARSSALRGTTISGDLIPRLIDEIPILAVAAAVAEGETTIRDAAELRVKESDRITALAAGLRAFGADVAELADGLVIGGGARLRGAACDAAGDHRLAMAFAVAALLAEGETRISGAESVAISYPAFWEDLSRVDQ